MVVLKRNVPRVGGEIPLIINEYIYIFDIILYIKIHNKNVLLFE